MKNDSSIIDLFAKGLTNGYLKYVIDSSTLPLGLKKFFFNYIDAGFPNLVETFSNPGLEILLNKKVYQANLKSNDLGSFVFEISNLAKNTKLKQEEIINYIFKGKITKSYYLYKGEKFDISPYSEIGPILYVDSKQTNNISK